MARTLSAGSERLARARRGGGARIHSRLTEPSVTTTKEAGSPAGSDDVKYSS